MLELLNNAWNGWGNFIFYGKYPALLLLVLLVFWFFSDRKREPVLLGYTTVITVCCIFPLTAALFMQYQTKFYDYQWVWSYVPSTIVIAFAATLVLGYYSELSAGNCEAGYWKKWFAQNGKVTAAALVLVILILLCGRLTDPLAEAKTDWLQSVAAEKVLAAIEDAVIGSGRAEETATGEIISEQTTSEGTRSEELVLWAPKEIMAAARIYSPAIQLPYGRDLWDASLGAYTYDTYTQVEDDLCQWMHCTGVFGTVDGYRLDGTLLEGSACVPQALELGVNCIVVPDMMTQEALAELTAILEKDTGSRVQMQQLEAYYIFTWN